MSTRTFADANFVGHALQTASTKIFLFNQNVCENSCTPHLQVFVIFSANFVISFLHQILIFKYITTCTLTEYTVYCRYCSISLFHLVSISFGSLVRISSPLWIKTSYGMEMAKLGFDLCDLDLWPLTQAFCMDVTSVSGNNSWKFHDDTLMETVNTMWGTDRPTDTRTGKRMDWTIHRAVWLRLKTLGGA